MEAVFVMFHIDLCTKAQFTSDINQLLQNNTEQMEDLRLQHPEDFEQEDGEEAKTEEEKEPLNLIGNYSD